MRKRELVAQEAGLKVLSIGVEVALRLGEASITWDWMQKGKSRAFADALGATILLPESLREMIVQDPSARELVHEEQMLLEMLAEDQGNHVIVSRRLAVLRRDMAENPLLQEVNHIKRGILDVDLGDEFKQALQDAGLNANQVKFVDWYVPLVDGNAASRNIVLFVRHVDGTTHTKELSLSVADVLQWLDDAFRYPEMSEPPLSRGAGNRLLKKMNGLVEGLDEFTSQDDLLVLIPPGVMENLPLHALFVKGTSLIDRNLVVYASTVSTFRQILFRNRSAGSEIPSEAESGETVSDGVEKHAGRSCDHNVAVNPSSFFAVYEEPDHVDERDAIFENINQLSSLLPGQVFLGPRATKAQFLVQAANCRWMHYHGHARVAKDIVKSSLCLSNGADLFASSGDRNDGHASEQDEAQAEEEMEQAIDELDVTQLFQAKFPAGMHLTVIACDSGRQESAPGNEPLGIVPALLYAGAASVLGSVWPIDSATGRKFSETFYKELSTQSKDGNSSDETNTPTNAEDNYRILHLAKALRATIRKMMKGELGSELRQPYHWAAFVLFGSPTSKQR